MVQKLGPCHGTTIANFNNRLCGAVAPAYRMGCTAEGAGTCAARAGAGAGRTGSGHTPPGTAARAWGMGTVACMANTRAPSGALQWAAHRIENGSSRDKYHNITRSSLDLAKTVRQQHILCAAIGDNWGTAVKGTTTEQPRKAQQHIGVFGIDMTSKNQNPQARGSPTYVASLASSRCPVIAHSSFWSREEKTQRETSGTPLATFGFSSYLRTARVG
jgi:hypothetical protein